RQHMAPPVKNSTRIDDHTWRMNFTGHHAFSFNFNTAFREDHAIEPTRNYDAIAFDLALDLGAFSQYNRLFGDDIALDVPVDAESTLNLNFALKRNALVNKSGPLFRVASAFGSAAGPLPRHL